MATKVNWHRYRTKLRHCHPMYTSCAGLVWPGGVVVKALDLRLRRSRDRLPTSRFQVTTLGQLFTHTHTCAVMPCGWEGNLSTFSPQLEYASWDFYQFWQECFAESRQMKAGIINFPPHLYIVYSVINICHFGVYESGVVIVRKILIRLCWNRNIIAIYFE